MVVKPAVHVSEMNGKLEGFRAISTNTLTNPFCIKMFSADNGSICEQCYSAYMLSTYRQNTATALQRNSDLLPARKLLSNEIPNILDAYFRFSAHGELINQRHFKNYILICERNPHCTFAIWSKRKDIIRKVLAKQDKPKNLILVYSNPRIGHILDKPPKGFDKSFNNVLATDQISRQNCTGQKCRDCYACYKFDTTDTIVEAVKKYKKRPNK